MGCRLGACPEGDLKVSLGCPMGVLGMSYGCLWSTPGPRAALRVPWVPWGCPNKGAPRVSQACAGRCSRRALEMPWGCPTGALGVPQVCPKSALGVSQVCPRGAPRLPWGCPRDVLAPLGHPSDIPWAPPGPQGARRKSQKSLPPLGTTRTHPGYPPLRATRGQQ